jgi:hypothetical protein
MQLVLIKRMPLMKMGGIFKIYLPALSGLPNSNLPSSNLPKGKLVKELKSLSPLIIILKYKYLFYF